MSTINIAQAKARLSQLVEQAERGEEVILVRHGRPVARIVRLSEPSAERYPQRGLGVDRGRFEVPADFDDDLPPELMRNFR